MIIIYTLAVGIVILFFWAIRKRVTVQTSKITDFSTNPAYYDHKIITLQGRVERVLTESLLKRLCYSILCWLSQFSKKRRYRHLRFLISSPEIKRGKRILIVHNLEFDAPHITQGTRIEVRGEYIHKSVNFYGLIHFTHEPRGYLRLL